LSASLALDYNRLMLMGVRVFDRSWTTVMVKVVEQLGTSGLGLEVYALAWSLALGACLGGNGALIGA